MELLCSKLAQECSAIKTSDGISIEAGGKTFSVRKDHIFNILSDKATLRIDDIDEDGRVEFYISKTNIPSTYAAGITYSADGNEYSGVLPIHFSNQEENVIPSTVQ